MRNKFFSGAKKYCSQNERNTMQQQDNFLVPIRKGQRPISLEFGFPGTGQKSNLDDDAEGRMHDNDE